MSNDQWTVEELEKLRRLALAGNMFYTEIARELGKLAGNVRHRARMLGLPMRFETTKSRMGKWNCKHSHLREAVLQYFLTHTFAETAAHFNLTPSELKSCITYAYKDPDLIHLRKSKTDHSPWSAEQLKFLLQHAGLKSREWVAKKIGRGNKTCIKERLQKLGLSSRTLQGLTLSQFRQAHGKDPWFTLNTTAGPGGGLHGQNDGYWKIVPWVWLDEQLKSGRLKTGPEYRIFISARAMFQEWIFEGDSLKKMQAICEPDYDANLDLKAKPSRLRSQKVVHSGK